MAGYTRQATANIVTGAVIDAADFNSEYNAIEAAFNASTGHAHDGTTGNGPPIENLGPAQDLVVTSSVVRPKVDDTYDLGTASIEWKDGFFDGTLRTDILTVDETSTLTGNVTASADVAIGGNLTVTGNATINGNLTFGDADTDTVSFGADITSSLIPDGSTQDLGSSSKQWRNLYIDGVAEIDGLNADTADINGGTIDGTVIGGNVAAAVTATTINASGAITGDLTGDVTGNVSGSAGSCTGNAATATKLATARAIAVSGAVTGTANFDGSAGITIATTATSDPTLTLSGDVTGSATFTNLGNATLATTIAANSVALGTDTTGNYAGSVSAGNGISVSGSAGEGTTFTVSHSDTSSQSSSNNSGRTYIQDITLDTYGHVTGIATATETVTNTDTNTTYSAGSGLDLSGTTFSVEADLRDGITHVGRDSNDYIAINTTSIDFVLDGNTDVRIENDGDLHADGNVIAYSTTISDQRLKHDIEKIDSALDKIEQLNGYTFSYNKDGKRSAGVLAQEVEKVLPSAVENKSLVFHGEEGVEYKTVQYDQLHGLLIEAIKELKEKLDECKCKKCECE